MKKMQLERKDLLAVVAPARAELGVAEVAGAADIVEVVEAVEE